MQINPWILWAVTIFAILLAPAPIWYARKKGYPIRLANIASLHWLGLLWLVLSLWLVPSWMPIPTNTPFSWEFLLAMGVAMGPGMIYIEYRSRKFLNEDFYIKRELGSHYGIEVQNIYPEMRIVNFSMQNGRRYKGRYKKINGIYCIIDESVVEITQKPNWKNS